MPSFPATDDEWTAIIDYFNTTSVKEAKANYEDALREKFFGF